METRYIKQKSKQERRCEFLQELKAVAFLILFACGGIAFAWAFIVFVFVVGGK